MLYGLRSIGHVSRDFEEAAAEAEASQASAGPLAWNKRDFEIPDTIENFLLTSSLGRLGR